MKTPERILEQTQELFYRYGTRSVTMDDIARHMGISKKTIYHFFADKESIVMAMMKAKVEEMQSSMEIIASGSRNAVDEILQTMVYISTQFSNLNSALIYDLQKFHPKAWKVFETHKGTFMKECIIANLKRGVKEGLYRDDLHIEMTAQLRLCQLEDAVNPSLFKGDFDFQAVNVCSLDLYLHSIVNNKGHKLLDSYTKPKTSTRKKHIA